MSEWVGKEAIRAARRVNLYDYLLSRHPNDVRLEGNSLRLDRDRSVSVKTGYAGYQDFSDCSTGNAIECLTRYLGYDFRSAVAALCEFAGIPTDLQPDRIDLRQLRTPDREKAEPVRYQTPPLSAAGKPPVSLPDIPRVFTLPAPVQGPYRHLYAYLTQQRGIPSDMVRILINDGLLYQEAGHNNMVFVDPAGTFAEYRGTNSAVPFHRVDFSDPSAFWWFKPAGPYASPKRAFVCECAIDAVSLYLLLRSDPANRAWDALYCGIGGVANQRRIDSIKADMAAAACPTVIAVDNDEAGEKCRERNPDCQAAIPSLKDWNAVLLECEKDPGMAHHDPDWLGTQAMLDRYGQAGG